MISISGCNQQKIEKSSSVSPGGYYRAELEVKDRGSCCRPSTSITLYDVKDRIGESEIIVFEGIGGWPIEVHWADPKSMVVVFCDGDRFDVKSGIFEDKEIERTGTPSRFNIQVITNSKASIDGYSYCKK